MKNLHLVMMDNRIVISFRKNMRAILFFAATLLLFCPFTRIFAQSETDKDKATLPKLVVVISVDQMRADFLTQERPVNGGTPKPGLGPLYTKGFKKLLTEGVVFTKAEHLHALTETAPGHAVISTGSHPSHHGIVSNDWWDRQNRFNVNAVGHPSVKSLPKGISQGNKSPIHLLRKTLGYYLKKKNEKSKVVSIAMKDRAAILMGGKKPDLASWFDTVSGQWITSDHYRPDLPDWLKKFNKIQSGDPYAYQYRKKTWKRLYPSTVATPLVYENKSRTDNLSEEASGSPETFETKELPHSVKYPYGSKKSSKRYVLVGKSPFGDQITLEMVKKAIDGEDLGQDNNTDLLWIGFSAPDLIGHLFGPWSQEMMDEYLRLDEVIGKLITFLDSEIGEDKYLLVLTADHGAPVIPEYGDEISLKPTKRRLKNKFEKDVRKSFLHRYPDPAKALIDADKDIFGFYFNLNTLKTNSIKRKIAEDNLRDVLLGIRGVEAVYTRTDILAKKQVDNFMKYYINTYYDGRSPDVLVRFEEDYMISEYDTGTSHGSPYKYDRHVPLIVFGNGFGHKIDTKQVAPVDIVPTILELLGIKGFQPEPDSNSFLTRLR